MRGDVVVLCLLVAGALACGEARKTVGPGDCGGPLAPDLATDRPWPEAVKEWALARPADSLVYPDLHYRSAVTPEDRALVTSAGGRVLYEYQGHATLSVEFSAAALATFASGDVEALQSRINQVSFGLSICVLVLTLRVLVPAAA